jgi:hypothetical protein
MYLSYWICPHIVIGVYGDIKMSLFLLQKETFSVPLCKFGLIVNGTGWLMMHVWLSCS